MMLLKVQCSIAAIMLFSASLYADVMIWGNDARGGNSHIEEFDASTGALVTSFLAPNPAAQGQIGRGIAIVGSNIYYSIDNSGEVYLTNPTGTDLGTAFNTGLPGIGSIASDGQFLYIAPTNSTAAGDESILKYSFGGSLISTVSLTPSTWGGGALGRTGLEIVGNDFIANQGDNEGPYDEFGASGNLIAGGFLNTGQFSFTGIAFDGSTYYVSDEEAVPSTLRLFNVSGEPMGSVTLTGCPGPNQQCDLQDLSVEVSAVPEPSAFVLLGLAVLGLRFLYRRSSGTAPQA